MKRYTLSAAFALLFSVFGAAGFAQKLSVPVSAEWRYKLGGDSAWLKNDFNDSSWEKTALPATISLQGENYITFRQTVKVPAELQKQTLYLDTGRSYTATEVYAGGILIGTNGAMPPYSNVRPTLSTVVVVPSNLIENGELHLALRCWTSADVAQFVEPLRMLDYKQQHVMQYWRNLFGARMYVVIAFICAAIGVYMLLQYILNPVDKTYLYYALSALAISPYFADMGAEKVYLPFLLQREISRGMLIVSIGFLLLFLRQFVYGKVTRRTKIFVAAIDAAAVIGHLALMHNFVAVNNFFTITLAPVMYVCIYGIVLAAKELKKRNKRMTFILGGFAAAVCVAMCDIFAQVRGTVPFVWLQGYAFFIMTIVIFITLSVEAANNARTVGKLMSQAKEQTKRLEDIFAHAKNLSGDTSEIAGSLNNAVLHVSMISQTSSDEIKGIESAIDTQEDALVQAREAVEKLLDSLAQTNQNLEREAESISSSAQDTSKLIEGIAAVSSGISGAANFAESLDSLTIENSSVMQKLSDAMEDVKERSGEILQFVQVLNDFSEKTNLLAMNASIEAAHAGVAGKGFAVVANEIKKLAAQSGEQATKISENVRRITDSINTGVGLCTNVQSSLAKMRQEAGTTASHIKGVAQEMALQEEAGRRIEKEAKNMALAADEMKKAAVEQMQYSSVVNKNMSQLLAASKTVEEAAQSIYAANKQLSENVNSLKTMSEKTEQTAVNLSKIINA